MVDVDSIKGCAVQSETVFHCSEASQSTTKMSKHFAATAGQLPLGTGGEFLVDQRRIFGTSNRENFTDMFFHSVAFNRKFPHQVPSIQTVQKSGEVPQCQHLDRYRRARREAETGPDQPDNPEDGRDNPEDRSTSPSAQRHVPIIQKIQKFAETPQVVQRECRSGRARRLLRHQEQLWTVPRILKFQKTVEYATGPCDSDSRRPCMSDKYRTWT